MERFLVYRKFACDRTGSIVDTESAGVSGRDPGTAANTIINIHGALARVTESLLKYSTLRLEPGKRGDPSTTNYLFVEFRGDAVSQWVNYWPVSRLELVSLYSLDAAVGTDRALVLNDPDSAQLLGEILDAGELIFADMAERIQSPDDIKSFARVVRARLLDESAVGFRVNRLSKQRVDDWLREKEITTR